MCISIAAYWYGTRTTELKSLLTEVKGWQIGLFSDLGGHARGQGHLEKVYEVDHQIQGKI